MVCEDRPNWDEACHRADQESGEALCSWLLNSGGEQQFRQLAAGEAIPCSEDSVRIRWRSSIRLQQLRQPREVHRHPLGFVSGSTLAWRAVSSLWRK